MRYHSNSSFPLDTGDASNPRRNASPASFSSQNSPNPISQEGDSGSIIKKDDADVKLNIMSEKNLSSLSQSNDVKLSVLNILPLNEASSTVAPDVKVSKIKLQLSKDGTATTVPNASTPTLLVTAKKVRLKAMKIL